MASFPDLLRKDRERRGFTVSQVAWRLGVKPQEYRQLEAGSRSPDFDTHPRWTVRAGWRSLDASKQVPAPLAKLGLLQIAVPTPTFTPAAPSATAPAALDRTS